MSDVGLRCKYHSMSCKELSVLLFDKIFISSFCFNITFEIYERIEAYTEKFLETLRRLIIPNNFHEVSVSHLSRRLKNKFEVLVDKAAKLSFNLLLCRESTDHRE